MPSLINTDKLEAFWEDEFKLLAGCHWGMLPLINKSNSRPVCIEMASTCLSSRSQWKQARDNPYFTVFKPASDGKERSEEVWDPLSTTPGSWIGEEAWTDTFDTSEAAKMQLSPIWRKPVFLYNGTDKASVSPWKFLFSFYFFEVDRIMLLNGV